MKKWWLVTSVLLVYLLGCSSSSGNQNPSNSGGSSNSPNNNNPAPQSNSNNPPSSSNNSPSNNNSDGNNSKLINIPSSNKPAPSGILEQISWGGQGGGSGPSFDQPCGNCGVELKENLIRLTGFSSSQRLQIPVYRYSKGDCDFGSADHVTTLSLQVDQNGNFESNLSGSTGKLILSIIYDSDTGEAVWFSYTGYNIDNYLECSTLNNSCPGAPPQRLEVNEMSYVCTVVDSVKLREGPGKNYSIIKSLVPGADVKIIGGPKCGDNWSWWQVRTESGFEGWMSEGGDSTDPYFLCPKK